MKTDFSLLQKIGLLTILLANEGCASGPKYLGSVQLVSNAQIEIVNASARKKPNGILVGGDVRRTNGLADALPGYLHVVGRDNSGNLVASTDAQWGEFKDRRFRRAYYKAFLQSTAPSSIAKITIESVTPRSH